jgi:hypothetical protein
VLTTYTKLSSKEVALKYQGTLDSGTKIPGYEIGQRHSPDLP